MSVRLTHMLLKNRRVYSQWPLRRVCAADHVHERWRAVAVCVRGGPFVRGTAVSTLLLALPQAFALAAAHLRPCRKQPSWLT